MLYILIFNILTDWKGICFFDKEEILFVAFNIKL